VYWVPNMVDSGFWRVVDELGRKVGELRVAGSLGKVQELVEEIYADALYLRLKLRNEFGDVKKG